MMKGIKIGNLLFRPKAIGLIACCMFLNGAVIGGLAAFKQSHPENTGFMVWYFSMFLSYLLLARPIRKNIIEPGQKQG